MYEFYNPHPHQKLVGDCVKRAITKASGKTYQGVSHDLNHIKREIGAKTYNSNKVWIRYVSENLNGIKESYPAVKGEPRMNGKTFCETHPKGVYILNMAKHLACCVDGVIYDTWDCLDKCVYNSYEIPQGVPETIINHISGEEIIKDMSALTDTKIKKTKVGELWISLDKDNYSKVSDTLLSDDKYKHLKWKTRKGSQKIKVYDESTDMTLVLKNGSSPYIWCTNNGRA